MFKPEPSGSQAQQALEYYSQPQVRERMLEYIQGARYLCSHAPSRGELFQPRSRQGLPELLQRGGDLYRSLWDEDGLVAALDLGYVEWERPVRTYHEPLPAFQAQAPILSCLQRILEEHDLTFRCLMTGRGYQLVWRITREGGAFEKLSRLGELSPGLQRLYDAPHRPLGKRVSLAKACAFQGLGMVLEWLGHQMLGRLSPPATPVRLAELKAVGAHAVICLDLSYLGEPLHRRSLRVPFSLYGKGCKFGCEEPVVCLPSQGLDLAGLLEMRTHPDVCAIWSGQASATIPCADVGTSALVESYLHSGLYPYHREFYRQRLEERTFPLTALDSLPAALRLSLEAPDRLFKPTSLQNLVRYLLARGWRGAEVCRLVESRLEQDHQWQPGVHFHEAGIRAEFYTRLFGGLMESGHDRLDDLNELREEWEELQCSAMPKS